MVAMSQTGQLGDHIFLSELSKNQFFPKVIRLKRKMNEFKKCVHCNGSIAFKFFSKIRTNESVRVRIFGLGEK